MEMPRDTQQACVLWMAEVEKELCTLVRTGKDLQAHANHIRALVSTGGRFKEKYSMEDHACVLGLIENDIAECARLEDETLAAFEDAIVSLSDLVQTQSIARAEEGS